MSVEPIIEEPESDDELNELDELLDAKCDELFKAMSDNKIEYTMRVKRYYSGMYTRKRYDICVFGYYEILVHMNKNKSLSVLHYQSSCSCIFDISEFLVRCETIRTLIEYCSVYLIDYKVYEDEIHIDIRDKTPRFTIGYGRDYDKLKFRLKWILTGICIESRKVDKIFKYLQINHKEIMKPRFLNTKSAKY